MKILSQLSDAQLSSMMSQDVATARICNGGLSPCIPLSPLRKKGVEHWKSFPLTTVEDIRRWQQYCLRDKRPALDGAETDIGPTDSCITPTGQRNFESQAPNDMESSFEESHSNSHELGPRPASSAYGSKTDGYSGQTDDIVSAPTLEATDAAQIEQCRREVDRPPYIVAGAESSNSYGVFGAISKSQSPFCRRDFAPRAPQELSSWIGAPPVKFQQQFLW